MRISIVASALLVVGAPSLAAPPADVAERAQAILDRDYGRDGPGAVAIIVDDGKTIFRGGSGYDDVEAKTPLDPARAFRIGSITKQFTSAMIMKLVDEGSLALDDPLSKHLEGIPQDWSEVTIHQLLNHTSGIRSYTSIAENFSPFHTVLPHTTAELIADFNETEMMFEPGTQYQYNNSGYVLLGAIIEEVTGTPWHEAIRVRLLDPLGIEDIRYVADYDSYEPLVASYTGGDKNFPSQKLHGSLPHAAGAFVGTLGALAEWTLALHSGKIVSAESLALMTTPTELPGAELRPYGYGLQVERVGSFETVGHGGGIFGFSTYGTYVPSEDLFVAVFANSDTAKSAPAVVTQRLLLLAAGSDYPDHRETPLDAAALADHVGRYRFADGAVRDFYLEDDALYSRREGQRAFEVVSGGEQGFFFRDTLGRYELAMNGDTPAIDYFAEASSEPVRGVRIGDVPEIETVELSAEQRASIHGRYRFDIGVLTVTAEGESGPITIQLEGQPAIEARPIDLRTLVVEQVGARIEFELGPFYMTGATIKQGGAEFAGVRIEE